MEELFRTVNQVDDEKRAILRLIGEVEIVHNLDTGQEELYAEDMNRLRWLGLSLWSGLLQLLS